MPAALGAKQLKLAGSWLSGAAKLAGYSWAADAIDVAVRSIDVGEGLRSGQDDAVKQALRRVRADVEAGTKAALAAEFGTDWERRADLLATIEALPLVLEHYALDTDTIFAANLAPERIAERMADAADAAHEDLFRRDTLGERMLRRVVTEAYAAALSNKDFALTLLLRGQREVLDRQDRHDAKLEAILAAVSAERGVPLLTLQRILEGFGEREVTLDLAAIEALLTAKAGEYRELRDRLGSLSNDDPRVQALRQQAGALIDTGDFAAVDAKLSEAERIDLAAVEDVEAVADRRRASAAASRAARAAAARLRLDYRTAAQYFGVAASIVARDEVAAWNYRLMEAGALYDHGSEFGDNVELVKAIRLYREEVLPRAHRADDWAATQLNLGTALATLGERESGTARLEEAVAAYRAALKEWTRERVPLNWAMTQSNLGNALSILGERESGTARLEEAVAAYRAALEERTRERVPLDWAMTQNNLGNALLRLGECESGTARLEGAVAAYRAALEERTRERVPLQWAGTQNNLGGALWKLGGRESGMARLEEAVAAYRAALEKRTRERVPLDWAMTQNNLGAALLTLGARKSGTARLEEAVAACRVALAERTRERVPLDWAMTQNNLGNALTALGERESGTARLEEAVAAYRAALGERTRERVPLDWAYTQQNLADALAALAKRQKNAARMEEALACMRGAVEVYRQGKEGYALPIAQRRVAEMEAELVDLQR